FSAGPRLQKTTPTPAAIKSEVTLLLRDDVIIATPRTSLSINFRMTDVVRDWLYSVLHRRTSSPRSHAAAWNPWMTSGKYGFAISEITSPNKSLWPVASRRA